MAQFHQLAEDRSDLFIRADVPDERHANCRVSANSPVQRVVLAHEELARFPPAIEMELERRRDARTEPAGLAKLRWGCSKSPREGPGERLVGVIARLQCDLDDRSRPALEAMGSAFQTEPSNVLGGRFAHEGTKQPMEVVRGRRRRAREILERQRVVEVLLNVDQRCEDSLLVARVGRGGRHHAGF